MPACSSSNPMDWLTHTIKSLDPVHFVYGMVAIMGGIARYLTGFKDGVPFKFSIFVASTFVAGFSGWMFAQIGLSTDMPETVVFIMAGTGGFMGEQTMKLVAEWVQKKVK